MTSSLKIVLIVDGLTSEEQSLIEASGFSVTASLDAHDSDYVIHYLDMVKPNLIIMARSKSKEKYITSGIMQKIRSMIANNDVQVLIMGESSDMEARRIAVDYDYAWVINVDDSPEIVSKVLNRMEKRQLKARQQKMQMLFADYIKSESTLVPGHETILFKDCFNEEFFQICKVRVLPPYREKKHEQKGHNAIALMGYSLLEKRMSTINQFLITRQGPDIIICLMGSRDSLDYAREQLSEYLKDMEEFQKTAGDIKIWISMGSVIQNPEDLPRSLAIATERMADRLVHKDSMLLEDHFDSAAKEKISEKPFRFFDSIKTLLNALETGDENKVRHTFRQLKIELQNYSNLSGSDIYTLFRTLISISLFAIESKNLSVRELDIQYDDILTEFKYFRAVEDMFHFLEKIYIKVVQKLQKAEFEELPAPILLAKRYINAYYNMPLSLHEISDYVHMNANYFSAYFSKYVGMTFKQYQTSLRIKNAKQLLLDRNNTLEDISEIVGYNDVKYFSRAFKRSTGLSPGEYRDQPNVFDQQTLSV